MKTILTIRPKPEKRVYSEEAYLSSIYGVLCDVGGVVGVYTGLSIAAIVRIFGILIAAGYVHMVCFEKRYLSCVLVVVSAWLVNVPWRRLEAPRLLVSPWTR